MFDNEESYLMLKAVAKSSLRSGLILVMASALAYAANPLTVISSASPVQPVAPASIVSAFGSDVATTTSSVSSANWPASLGGTTVSITDSAGVARPAPIAFVSSGQVNFEVPAQSAAGPATATITSADGTVSSGPVQIAAVAPGLYSANSNGQGAAAAVVLQVGADGSQTSSFSFACGATPLSCVPVPITVNSSNGAQTILELFGTGIRGASSQAAITCTVGGTPAQVLYAGPQNVYPGLDQVNVVLPAAIANQGQLSVVLSVQGQTANTVVIATGPAISTTHNFFVAPNGNDQWSGTLATPNAANTDGPFASLAMAQSAVRRLITSSPGQPVSVILRNGTYYLPLSPTNPGTLNFTSADSGTANARVTWRNYPGETPVVSGGMPLGSTWKNVSGNLWQTPLPASTQAFEYLFYNGQRRLRSRVASPSGVGYYMKSGSCYSTSTGQTVALSECNLELSCEWPLKLLPPARMRIAPASQALTALNPSVWIASDTTRVTQSPSGST